MSTRINQNTAASNLNAASISGKKTESMILKKLKNQRSKLKNP